MPAENHSRPREEGTAGEPRRLRAAVLTGAGRVPEWQVRTIRRLAEVDGVELVLWLVAPSKGLPTARRREDGRPGVLEGLAERALNRPAGEAFRPGDLSDLLDGVAVRRVSSPSDGGQGRLLNGAAAQLLEAARADLLLDLAPGERAAPSFEVPPLGVWRLRHGSGPPDIDAPPGAAEILAGEPLVAASLVRLGPRGRETVLEEGRLRTVPASLAHTRSRLLLGTCSWPARMCRGLLAGSPSVTELFSSRGEAEGRDGNGPEAGFPPPGGTLRPWTLLAVLLRNRFRERFRDYFRHEEWAVGILDRPVGELAADGGVPEDGRLGSVRWIRAGARERYLADPFGIPGPEGLVILAEEFDYRERRGWIRALEVDGGTGSRDRGRVLPLPVHASYPYLFRHGGEIYCVPETVEAREVALFRARHFPYHWEKEAVLLEDFAAADPTVFRFRGRWWLLAADNDGETSTHLHAWHAAELAGTWRPHPLNPLKSDAGSARPAGTPFLVDGELYRPAQDCSRTYGGAVVIHRVLRLSPTEFREEPVRVLRPDPEGPFPAGLHTLADAGEVTLIDGKRDVLVPSAFLRSLRQTLRLA